MLKILLISSLLIALGFTQDADTLKDTIHIQQRLSKVSLVKPSRDPWLSQDKFLHFSACAAIAGFTHHIYVYNFKKDENSGKIYSISLTGLVGLGKEIYDRKKKGQFSWKDLFWDGLGLTAAYFIFIR
jgi:uncharacterized protein YfiM (DUF2279 family)